MTVAVAQSRTAGLGQIYLDFTVTDSVYSNPRFLIGSNRFYSTNAAGGAPVVPCVISWGSFQGGISSGIAEDGGGRIIVDANAKLIPSNGTTRVTISQWLRELQFREAEATLYQWNSTESTQEVIWKGYIVGVTSTRFVDGVYQAEVTLSPTLRDLDQAYVSDLVTKGSFSTAPLASLGKMIPRPYGKSNEIISTTDVGAGLARVGLPISGLRGVVIDENQASAKVKVRFAKNDGVSAWTSFPTGTADDAGSYGGLWIMDQASGLYGMVDTNSYSVTNDTAKCEVLVDGAPKVFFFLKPSQLGSHHAAGLTDAYKILDSDPSNYSTSTVTDYSWAFYLPSVSFGGRIKSIGVVADWQNAHATKTRQVTIGIWDIYRPAGAYWLSAASAKHRSISKAVASPRIISMQDTATYRYTSLQFRNHLGDNTDAEFATGNFITKDGSNNQATLELLVDVDELGGGNAGRDGVRLYNVGIVIEVDYPIPPRTEIVGYRVTVAKDDDGNPFTNELIQVPIFRKTDPAERTRFAVGTHWFARGSAQSDTGAGKYTGSASTAIEKPQDIAYHLLDAVSAQTVNASAGTLGNFVDPRSSGVTKDMKLLLPLGPETISKKTSIERITKRFPIRLRRKAGTWHCIPEDMVPHSSRVYRSTSEPITIGPNDIELDSFTERELDVGEIINSVQVNYSHGYPDREPGAHASYENPVSQKWFGKKATTPYEYPEMLQFDMSGSTDAGVTALTQWLGRRFAMPRRVISCQLFQKFYDLEPGHCLQLKGLESAGIYTQAFRSGLLHYYFNSDAGTVDYADSTATVFINAASSVALIGLPQQTDGLNFGVQTAAAYTSVANAWRYSASGGTFSNFSNIVNTDALKTTGTRRVSWDKPNWWDWIKTEQTINGVVCGPCYWIEFLYGTVTNAGLGNARITYSPTYEGRTYEVMNATRLPGRKSKDYPYKEVVLMETM